jgi:hypothetical protein
VLLLRYTSYSSGKKFQSFHPEFTVTALCMYPQLGDSKD